MPSPLRHKKILLTGACGGLGTALTRQLAARQLILIGTDVDNSRCESWKQSAMSSGAVEVEFAPGDVCKPEQLQSIADKCEKSGPIDVVIANAGVGWNTPIDKFDPEVFRKQVDINLNGVANTFAAVLPGMLRRKSGHLVAIASLAGYRGLPVLSGYCASKAGVIALMEGLRLELQPHGIHCTTISPGWMNTGVVHTLGGPKPSIRSVDEMAEKIVRVIERKRKYYAFPLWLRTLLQLNRSSFASIADPMANLFLKWLK